MGQTLKLLLVLPLFALGCNENDFSGSSGGPSDDDCEAHEEHEGEEGATDTATAAGLALDDCDHEEPPPPVDEGCIAGDKVNLKFGNPAVQECLDGGKTFNFDKNVCVAMRQSTFACDWPTLTGELQRLNLLTPTVQSAASSSLSKLVSCGQASDGNRIAVQWINLPADGALDCNFDPSKMSITTGCYTNYVNTQPPAATTPEERAKQVYACLDAQ
jgi:hypothetical protein